MAQQFVHPLGGETDMVGLAQLAEHRIVVPGVVGSSPISHPTGKRPAAAGREASFIKILGCSVMVTHRTLTPI